MKKSTEEIVVGCIGAIIATILIDFVVTWLLWLIYNAVAPQFHWPSVSYWTMFLIVMGLSILGNFLRRSES